MHKQVSSDRLVSNACKIILGFFLVAMTGWCQAEAKLRAYVVHNTEKGSPVAQVQFSADGQHEVSLSDGRLEMRFAQRNAGDVVRLVMQRTGWEVVNRHVLEHTLLNHHEARPIEIIIAKESEYGEMALAFYRLKGNNAVIQEVQRKLSDLQRNNKATTEALTQLQQEREQARKQVDELARQLAQAKPGEAGEVYNQAVKLFFEGKPDQALELLSEDQLERNTDTAQKKIKQSANEWRLRAQILAVKFDFTGASKAYKKTTELLPDDGSVWTQYAVFHQNQNQWAQARQGYERALGLYRAQANQIGIATVLNDLGCVHHTENRWSEAHAAYEEALQINRQLEQKNPDIHLHSVAANLVNLGILFGEQKHWTEAHAALEESLQIYRQLALKNPDRYLRDVAGSLNNIASLYHDENRLVERRKTIQESHQIYQQLALKNPDVYLPDVALSLNNLGNLYIQEEHWEDAYAALEKSLQIRRQLALKNPDAYLPEIAMSLNTLGNLYIKQKRWTEARAAHEESLQIRRQLALTCALRRDA